MSEPRYIGLDCAATTGFAFKSLDGAWELGTVRADSTQKHDVLSFAKEHGVTHAVLEKPVPMTGPRKGKKGNHATTQISMGRSMGRWEEACDMAGIVVVPCYVAQWQAALLVRNGTRMKQDDSKQASLFIAKTLGAFCRNADEADAVCLATYGPQALARMLNEADEKAEKKRASAKAAYARRKARCG